ncbi:MAG: hypothetical protein ACYS74_00970 [Planctomycetota bacterium]
MYLILLQTAFDFHSIGGLLRLFAEIPEQHRISVLRIHIFAMRLWFDGDDLDGLLRIPLPGYGNPQLQILVPVNLVRIGKHLESVFYVINTRVPVDHPFAF